jgi:hypothetical protein
MRRVRLGKWERIKLQAGVGRVRPRASASATNASAEEASWRQRVADIELDAGDRFERTCVLAV